MTTATATNTSPVSGLSDEQQDFVNAIRDFAKREAGTAEQRENLTDHYTELHNHETSAKLGELGYLGASVPEEYGGTGGGMVDACLFLEEAFRGLLPIAGYPVTLITAGAVNKFGTDEQKQQVIGGMTEGKVSAIAMSEPEAGSDVGALSARAEKSNGGYVLNGQKTWISAAHLAEQILIIVRTDKTEQQARGPDDVPRPHRLRGDRDQPDRDDGRQGDQRRLHDRPLPRRLPRSSARSAAAGRS